MKRIVTWITMVALISSTLYTSRCFAADATLDEHIARYQETVLPDTTDRRSEARAVAATGGGSLLSQMTGLLLAAGDDPAETEQPTPYVAWPDRRGPAYPDDDWHSFGRDAKELPHTVWADTKSAFSNRVVIVGMLAAGTAGIAINAAGCDDNVDDQTRGDRHLSKGLDGVGGFFGSPAVHFPLAAAMYATGLWTDDTKLYEVSKTLMNALIINGVTNMTLKWAARTESPNGDELGWPSGHTSSSFCVAAVMNEAYGPWVGVPLYAFATFVGYERIDARNHDLSDVVSGAIIGTVIGYAVATDHEPKIFGMDVLPMATPDGTVGVMLAKQW